MEEDQEQEEEQEEEYSSIRGCDGNLVECVVSVRLNYLWFSECLLL